MIPPGSHIVAEIERFDAELRQRWHARLASGTERDAAESEIATLVEAKERELTWKVLSSSDLPVLW